MTICHILSASVFVSELKDESSEYPESYAHVHWPKKECVNVVPVSSMRKHRRKPKAEHWEEKDTEIN